jgi:hypothetical protein
MVGEAGRKRHRTAAGVGAAAWARPPSGKKPSCDKDLALDRARIAVRKTPAGPPMEAEQLNQIANTLADLKTRSAEMRRYL